AHCCGAQPNPRVQLPDAGRRLLCLPRRDRAARPARWTPGRLGGIPAGGFGRSRRILARDRARRGRAGRRGLWTRPHPVSLPGFAGAARGGPPPHQAGPGANALSTAPPVAGRRAPVQPVLAPVPAGNLGVTLTHEHLLCDLTPFLRAPENSEERAFA